MLLCIIFWQVLNSCRKLKMERWPWEVKKKRFQSQKTISDIKTFYILAMQNWIELNCSPRREHKALFPAKRPWPHFLLSLLYYSFFFIELLFCLFQNVISLLNQTLGSWVKCDNLWGFGVSSMAFPVIFDITSFNVASLLNLLSSTTWNFEKSDWMEKKCTRR